MAQEVHPTDIGEEQTRCSVCHRHDAVQAYITAHQPRWHTRTGRRIQKTYRQTDIRQLSSPGGSSQDMEPQGETPGGMPLYQRDSRTIPQSSGHEEEVDGLDARKHHLRGSQWLWLVSQTTWRNHSCKSSTTPIMKQKKWDNHSTLTIPLASIKWYHLVSVVTGVAYYESWRHLL